MENGTNGSVHTLPKRLVCAIALLTALAMAQDTILRVDVHLVRVLTTVRDPSGKLLGTLDNDNFTVLDNGVSQTISVFERRTEQPLSVALLIDISGSTAKDLKFETESVNRFLRTVFADGNPEDMVGLYSFNYQVTKQTPYTRSMSKLDERLRSLHGEAATALYDAIWLASGELGRRQGRHVLLIVTDGGDTFSAKEYKDALEAAHNAEAVIYPVLIIPVEASAGRNTGGEHALTTLAQSTGGRVFQPTLGASLDSAFADILRELRTQYLIGYYPHDVPPTRERFHKLEVRVNQPGLRVIARNGYYGESIR